MFGAFYIVNVQLNYGIIKSVTFETSCNNNSCNLGGSYCVDTDCGILAKSATSSINEDLKVYVAFSGTDSLATELQSINLLPSRYSAFVIPGLSAIQQFFSSG